MLTGDLEHLHIVDIIQLVHTTRKSGLFSVKGAKGESRIVFSNGYIVAASHLSGKVRIGSILVGSKSITRQDLLAAIKRQNSAGKNRKPLLATLIDMGKLDRDGAFRGLKKIIEITMVELVGWSGGTFAFDTDAIIVSHECTYQPGSMEQEFSLDAQMVLMDALRIYDERQRDLASGSATAAEEELFTEAAPEALPVECVEKAAGITADDLGLADIDSLERIIPKPFSPKELFDPAAIHRQHIKETLSDFSPEQQEIFVSFLERSSEGASVPTAAGIQEGSALALVLFSRDALIKHSVMTICKNDGVLVFSADREEELHRIIDQCLQKMFMTVLVFDAPEAIEGGLSEDKMKDVRRQTMERYSGMPAIQFASAADYAFSLDSYREGIRTVIPKPVRTTSAGTFIQDAILFLETFRNFIRGFPDRKTTGPKTAGLTGRLRERLFAMKGMTDPPDISFSLLQAVAEIFERSITFIVRPKEIVGEWAIGIQDAENKKPTSAIHLKAPLTGPSVFLEVINKGEVFYGRGDDPFMKEHLYQWIGEPKAPVMLLLPLISRQKVVTVTYGDFGMKDASSIDTDILEILALHAGAVLDAAVYRKQLQKASK